MNKIILFVVLLLAVFNIAVGLFVLNMPVQVTNKYTMYSDAVERCTEITDKEIVQEF